MAIATEIASLEAKSSEKIRASWNRCEFRGLKNENLPKPLVLSETQLQILRERNHKFLTHAVPTAENTYEQVEGTGSAVIVADKQGILLYCRADSDFLNRDRRTVFSPGAQWAEEYLGTNAIGTCLANQSPICVRADEHFLTSNRYLSGCASPVFDYQGSVAGILGLYSTCESAQLHTLGFVRTTAILVENRMLVREMEQKTIVYFHPSPDYLGTIKQCIVAFAKDGRLLGLNSAARRFLNITGFNNHESTFSSIFNFSFQALFDQTALSGPTPIALSLHDGRPVFAATNVVTARLTDPAGILPGAKGMLRLETHHPSVKKAPDIRLVDLDTGDSMIHRAIEKVSMIIGCDIPLMIEGESGVGKEMFTRAFHNSGPRCRGPFVAVNCAAIPEGLIESELFGYDEGAFTGAKRKGYEGKILQANKGTLFLDEIGDMPLSLQGRLLRVLQERQVMPLGSAKSTAVDLSIVCATHRNIRNEVAAGRFREDLYYRLNGFRILLPSLRQREDLEQLVSLITWTESGGKNIRLAPETARAFRKFSWPGNIRQLQMVLRTALALVGDGDTITLEHLPDDFVQESQKTEMPKEPADVMFSTNSVTGGLARVELDAIKRAVEAAEGNISEAARHLGISRKTLYRKLGKLE